MAIPTMYRDVKFRSRLEARWARFFDVLGWPWQYEPIDLNSYIPDFILQFEDPILVEVKPAVTLAQMAPAEVKIDLSGWHGEAIVVGVDLWEAHRASPMIGRFGELTDVPGESHEWDTARIAYCCQCGKVSPYCEERSWRCRVCARNRRLSDFASIPCELIEKWFECGNVVQWMPTRKGIAAQ